MERWMSFGRYDADADTDVEFVGQTEADASELKRVNDGNGNPKYGSFDPTDADPSLNQESKSRDLVG